MVAAVSGRALGNMRFHDGARQQEVSDSRKRFVGAFDFHAHDLVTSALVHKGDIGRVYDTDAGKGALDAATMIGATDGLVTRSVRTLLGVTVADCLPIFVLDVVSGSYGVLHAGWRGIAAGIIERGIMMMSRFWATTPSDYRFSIGPSIRACHFVVQEDVAAVFGALSPDAVDQRSDGWHVDLQAAVKHILRRQDVRQEQIEDVAVCTVCQKDYFFSARGNAPWGGDANLAFIGRKEAHLAKC